MNKWIGCGRLTRDPEMRDANGTMVARYSLAIDRKGKKEETDYINCVCFGKTAEFAEKYLKKGTKILIVGRIQTGSYTNKDGQKVYTTDIVVEEHEFVESKANNDSTDSKPADDNFMKFDGSSAELPF